MVLNDTSGKDGLLQQCESLCNLGDGGITGNATLKAKFVSWLNNAYGKAVSAILTVDKQWRWDDFNWSSPDAVNVATANLVSGQRDYILPRATNSSDQSTLWKVYNVRLKNIDGTWYDLTPMSAYDDEIATSGKPKKYMLLANSIRLSGPALTGSIDLVAGIQVWFQREFKKFATSGTDSQQPGIISSFHYLLPIDASATYLLPINTNLANQYINLFLVGTEKMKTAYSQRNDDPNASKRMTPKVEDNR